MTDARRLAMIAGLTLSASACTLAPSPYGGPPVVDRSVRTAPPANVPPPVEVTPLQQPQPLQPQLQTGPMIPQNPYAQSGTGTQQGGAPVGSGAPNPVQIQPQGNQAVVALLDSAATHVNSGDLDKAAASLERALRIEPRNAGIWHDLAQVRLHQGQYQQAESLASKSNSLAGSDRSLQARNWRVIGSARRSAGDSAGADAADAQATTLSRG